MDFFVNKAENLSRSVTALSQIIYGNSIAAYRKLNISAIKISRSMLLKEKKTLFNVRSVRNTQIHCTDRIQSSSMLKQLVRIEPLGVKRLTAVNNIVTRG